MRAQRAHNAGAHRSGLRHRQHGDDARDERPEEQPPNQVGRRRSVLASALALIAPRAWPPVGAALETTGAAPPFGRRSNSAALAAPEIRPTATPCSARAANSSPTPWATRNKPHPAAPKARPASITIRRPA